MPFLKRVFQPKTPADREFQATLYTRLETGYNIAVNCNGATGLVVVVQVDKGPGTKWNTIYPDRQIEPNLRILQVNGLSDCFEMVDELRASSEAVIRFRRPVKKRLLVIREPRSKLGVTLLDFDASSVWVDQVLDLGAVPEWNEQNPLEKVTTGTRIVEVNGVSGNVHRMYEQLRKEGVLELVVESHGPETANRKALGSLGTGRLKCGIPDLTLAKQGWGCVDSEAFTGTSIATPETHGRSRKSFSPSPDAFGDSELELSLELVNHVPPHIADRLMDRLRSAEAARQFVENQCEAGSTLSSNFSVPGLPWLLISMVFLAQATAFLHGAAPMMTPAQQTLVNHLEAASPAEVEVTGDLNFTCEAFLWEAEREAMELQRRHQQLQAAFSGALEAASNWVGFLQKATQRRYGMPEVLR
ncbi:unnamed protein product [Cladocopium goreaui]|uniref:Uncharacterized protein n=1 Tax=Cladocopium goreaui TaxID=2562237 RepID=A0A9P1FEB0_9DINO|nr:unnamed protein product [Cladocopium goreaui]